jgi:xanthine dehydrogenase large subunit
VKQVGVARSHESARAHVTGSAKYVDDLWPSLTGTVHLWPVTVPHAHAKILGLDSERALSSKGVLTVLTGADVPGINDVGPTRRDEPLFPSEVCFHGQAVAWVVAETEAEARSAAALVVVNVEPLPAILSIREALSAQSFHTATERIASGDVEAALARAELRLDGQLEINGQEHFYLETQAALAVLDESEGVFVHSSTQHPAETQEIVARVLGVPRHAVVVQCLRMGGAFGGKEVQANAWAALAALAAKKLRRPARVRLTRQQDLRLTGKRHPFLARFRVGFTRGGKLQALDIELFSDGGWCLDLSAPVLFRAMFHVDNCYAIEHLRVSGQVCRTHNVSHTAFRGFGGPQGMLVIEEVLDRVARTLQVPPHLLREGNFYRRGDCAHYGQEIRDADRIGRIWSELKASSQFGARWREIERYNAENRHDKRGLAITPVKFGISFTTAFFNQAGALVMLYRDGSVQVNHGGTEMGQGLHTKIAQIAADALGVTFDAIRIMPTRTDKVPNTSASAASASTDLNGAAVVSACNTLQRRLAAIAALHFQTAAENIQFDAGHVYPAGQPARAVAFAEIVDRAYLARVPLFSSGYYRTPNLHFDRAKGKGKPFHYYAYGAAVCEVGVSGFTGQYALRRVDILHDVGDSLSPLIDRGQVEGGFIQGVGWLTTEELVWSSDGALLTSGASTYKLPTLGECPPELRVALLARAAEPGVVFGSKAVGEPPLMLAISVREALRAAVAAFGPSGHVVELATPATPEAVFWAIEAARQKQGELRQSSAAQ